MKSIQKMFAVVLACCLSLAGGAAAPKAVAATGNSLQAIDVAPMGGDTVVKIDFKEPITVLPTSFSISKPARIALDFPSTSSALDRSSQSFNQGDLSSVNVVQAGDRTRVVLNLLRSLNYETRIEGNSLLVNLKKVGATASAQQATVRFAEETLIGRNHVVTDISFRRGKEGEARILVDLSDAGAGIDIRQQGASLVVDFMKTKLPEHLRRKLDVTDFATPVTNITTSPQGENTRMVISPKGLWEHTAYQTDNHFVIEVKPIVEDPNKLVQGSKTGYQGPRVSINYQNGDVRALLRLMAEELGLNAVISETVTGATTLVLKEVPADQVVDIIFQQKGLDMRKNGNVILIAPREELALREKLDAEAKQELNKLESLRMEAVKLNYQKAEDLAKLLMGTGTQAAAGGAGAAPGGASGLRMLSARGSVTPDPVTNQIFINDIPSKIEEVKRFLKLVDVAAKQVLIEARVVEASDTFTKELGARMGFLGDGMLKLAGNGSNNSLYIGGGSRTSSGTVGQTFGFNLPGQTIQQSGAQPGTLSFSLFNKSLTKILNLELSALEFDNAGKIISSPKLVTANNMAGTIEDGWEIPYQTYEDGKYSVKYKKVMLSLTTTPIITPDGRVKMKLEIKKDDPRTEWTVNGNFAVKTTNITTDVVVENGGTVVIGGVFKSDTAKSTDRIPFLGDLPYVGFMFKHTSDIAKKQEVLIFITPRILNDELTVN